MTDNEIIKALECCIKDDYDKGCAECPVHCYKGCDFQLAKFALELINRQKAEIERLTALVEVAEDYLNPLPFKNAFDEEIEKTKTEAIKEFAERLKEKACKLTEYDEGGWDYTVHAVKTEDINTLVKEMTEN